MYLTRPHLIAHPSLTSFVHPKTLSGKTSLAISASFLVALCAHVSLPFPFTPVPFTLSDLAVLSIGLVFGARAGFSALLLYLFEGASGLPVFTPGGLGGIAQLLGPTGGFLVSYPLTAAIAGALASIFSRFVPRFAAGFLAALCASAVLFGMGAAWLATVLHLQSGQVLHLAVFPFLYGNLVKIIIASGIYSAFADDQGQS